MYFLYTPGPGTLGLRTSLPAYSIKEIEMHITRAKLAIKLLTAKYVVIDEALIESKGDKT